MDVDINIVRIDGKEQEVRHLLALRNEPLKCSSNSLVEIWMPHVASVDEEILVGHFFA